MRVVFDTNVIIAGIVAQGFCREIVEIHLPGHTAIASKPLLAELEEKLRVKFREDPEMLPLFLLYRRHALLVEPARLEKQVSRDPEDDQVLATALAGQAEVIVTGDDDLLVLKEFEGISILSPRAFVEIVAKAK